MFTDIAYTTQWHTGVQLDRYPYRIRIHSTLQGTLGITGLSPRYASTCAVNTSMSADGYLHTNTCTYVHCSCLPPYLSWVHAGANQAVFALHLHRELVHHGTYHVGY